MIRTWKRILRAGLHGTLIGAVALAALTAAAQAATVRIGVQKYGTLVILAERHTLEERLKAQGVSVEWREFPGGPQLLEALTLGSIDLGTTGEAPPVFAQAAGSGLVYIGAEKPAPKGEAILVPKGSTVKTIADLKGRRVALNKGSNVHFLLLRALESVGLTIKDVTPVYLAPSDARAAFEQGAVDAWAIWDPFLSAAEAATGGHRVLDGAGLVPNRQFYLADGAYAKAHPDIVHTILEEIETTDLWARDHQKEVATLLSPRTGIAPEILERSLANLAYGVGPLDATAIADQQAIADAFFAAGLIPKKLSVKEIVNNSGF